MNDIEDIFNNPSNLAGKTPDDMQNIIEDACASGHWEKGTLRRGSRRGMGMVLREVMPNGNYTGRMLQWHPGGGHHGSPPYWKVSSPATGTIRLGPQFKSD